MSVTRRDLIRVAGVAPILVASRALGAAKGPPKPSLTPIDATRGTRLYPTFAQDPWWTTEPVTGWDLPSLTSPSITSLGASLVPDGATTIIDSRNTPRLGMFTRAYFQFSTRPLQAPPGLHGVQTLYGVVSAAIHCVEAHSRINATLAMQIVVHRPDKTVRGVPLPLWHDTLEFTVGTLTSRAAQNWTLTPVDCLDGDVIAINLGIRADNQTGTLARTVGFAIHESEPGDIVNFNDPALLNTWVDFSAPLQFEQ